MSTHFTSIHRTKFTSTSKKSRKPSTPSLSPLIDGQEGMKAIGHELKDEKLKTFFLAESLKRAEFRGELETALHTEGDHNPKESGSVSGRSPSHLGRLESQARRRRSHPA